MSEVMEAEILDLGSARALGTAFLAHRRS